MRRAMLAGTAVMAMAVAPLGPAAAQDAGMADLDDFALRTGQDLVDLCAVGPDDAMYDDAMMFCLGVVEGMIQYHDAIAHGPDGIRVVCPEGDDDVTRSDLVATFVTWGKANPDQASAVWPAEALVMAALDRWGACAERSR